MKIHINIEALKELLQNERPSSMFAKEIYRYIENSQIRIHESFTIMADNILATYTIRERIQREITRKEIVLGYDVVLPNLAQEKKSLIAVFRVSAKESSYLIFADEALKRMIGILKFPYSSFHKEAYMGKDYLEDGLKDGGKTYNKGVEE